MLIRKSGRVFCITILAMSLADAAHAQTQFGKIVSFGDSLSDGGTYTNYFKSLNLAGRIR
jgi:phospholipase/lecithinase/hemolysin